jgi:hypothetical protein
VPRADHLHKCNVLHKLLKVVATEFSWRGGLDVTCQVLKSLLEEDVKLGGDRREVEVLAILCDEPPRLLQRGLVRFDALAVSKEPHGTEATRRRRRVEGAELTAARSASFHRSTAMIWILELVILLLFVGFGGFEGFIAWAILSALIMYGRHSSQQAKLKAAEVMIRAERLAMDQAASASAGAGQRAALRQRAESSLDAHRPLLSAATTGGSDLPATRQCPKCGTFSRRTPCTCGFDLSQPPPVEPPRSEVQRPRSQEVPALATAAERAACQKCGDKNDEDAVFCNACGASIVVARVCACGTTNPRDARFCKKCGRSFELSAPAPVPATPSDAPRKPRPSADMVHLRNCEDCGTKNRGDAYKCSSCGRLFR